MSQPKQFDAYRKTDILTASRETVLLMMYEGMIRFLKQAIEQGKAENWMEQGRLLRRTLDIISELRSSLNYNVEGDLPLTLDKLYSFVTQRILEGELKKDFGKLEEALQVIVSLHEAWVQAVQSIKKEQEQENRKDEHGRDTELSSDEK